MKKPNKNENTMPPLVPEEEEAPRRTGSGAKWVTFVCILLAAALIVASLPSGISAATKVNDKIFSAMPEENVISTVLSGGGTLEAQEGTAQSIPQALELRTYYVKNGETVSAGDPIAQVDAVAVKAAISELQGVLDTLDDAIAAESGKTNDTTIRAGAAGRVKKIYAREGASAADAMYENGALLLLSLDGLMAVDLEAQAEVGARVTVTLSDGTALDGTVESVSDGIATVTVSDETAALDDIATVQDEAGTLLGTGNLYIHARLRVTGAYGIVSAVSVRENQKVSADSTLLTLKDTGHTAEYTRLLNRRSELEAQMESLVKLSDGVLYADCGGIVSGVDSTVAYTDPAALTRARSQASPGYTAVGGTRMEGTDTGTEPDAGENPDPSEPPEPSENPDPSEPPEPSENPDPSEPSEPSEGPEEPEETVSYVVGLVTAVSEGSLEYIPQLTIEAKKSQMLSFAGLVDPSVSAEPQALQNQGQTVLLSTGGMWTDSAFAEIAPGDAILIGGNTVVYAHMTASTPGGGEFPGMDMSQVTGMDAGALTGAMSGMTGGLSGYGTVTAVYDSYDTTLRDAAVITADEEMTVQIQVDELDILTLQTGMAADVTLDALTGTGFTGTITSIDPYGANSGGNTKYTVTVTLPREENMLPGMNASVKITTAVSEPVRTVPAEAILFDSGKSWLYTGYNEKTDTLTDPVEIRTGRSDGAQVELLSGLEEGQSFYYRYADSIEYSFVR